MALNLTKKITGPMSGAYAKSQIRNSLNTLYVVEFDFTRYGDEVDPDFRFITNNGRFFHGFIMDDDVIVQITVWKD